MTLKLAVDLPTIVQESTDATMASMKESKSTLPQLPQRLQELHAQAHPTPMVVQAAIPVAQQPQTDLSAIIK